MDLFNESEKTTKVTTDKLDAFQSIEDSTDKIAERSSIDKNLIDTDLLTDIDSQAYDPFAESTTANPDKGKVIDISKVRKVNLSDETASKQPAESIKVNKEQTKPEIKEQPVEQHQKLSDVVTSVDYDKILENINDVADTTFLFGKRFLGATLGVFQEKSINKRFSKGMYVKADDFIFLCHNNELMAYKYVGSSQQPVMPDFVGNLPVRYVYSGLLSEGLIDNHNVRSFFNSFRSEEILDLSTDKLKSCIAGITSIQLSNQLLMLPRNLFSGCLNIQTIKIPKSVKVISPYCFSWSKIQKVLFEGLPPRNADILKLPKCTQVFVKPTYVALYKRLIANYRERFLEREALDNEKTIS